MNTELNETEETLEDKRANDDLQSAFDEEGLNGRIINWDFWVHRKPALNSFQAACLMSALEPNVFKNLDGKPGIDDSKKNIEKVKVIQLEAEEQGRQTASAAEWVEWAQSMGFKVYKGFTRAVRELPEATVENTQKAEAVTDATQKSDAGPWLIQNKNDPAPEQPWYTPARYFARQLVKDDSTLLVKRSVLAQKTAKSLTNVGIFKRGGKEPLSSTTILKAFVNCLLG